MKGSGLRFHNLQPPLLPLCQPVPGQSQASSRHGVCSSTWAPLLERPHTGAASFSWTRANPTACSQALPNIWSFPMASFSTLLQHARFPGAAAPSGIEICSHFVLTWTLSCPSGRFMCSALWPWVNYSVFAK